MEALGKPGLSACVPLPAPQTPLLATSAISSPQLFPIPRWRVRSGLTAQHHQFKRGVVQLFAAYGLAPEALHDRAPSIRIISPASQAVLDGSRDGVTTATVADQKAELNAWLRINTAMYWHILPALDISGPQYLEDLASIDSYASGQQADARGLLMWAFGLVDLSGFEPQLALSNALGSVKLAGDATLAQLASHLHKLQQVWQLTTAANTSVTYAEDESVPLVQLYQYLLNSMGPG